MYVPSVVPFHDFFADASVLFGAEVEVRRCTTLVFIDDLGLTRRGVGAIIFVCLLWRQDQSHKHVSLSGFKRNNCN
jgi:hypothetical protein